MYIYTLYTLHYKKYISNYKRVFIEVHSYICSIGVLYKLHVART